MKAVIQRVSSASVTIDGKIKSQIKKIFVRPSEPVAYPPAVDAIRKADLIVIGPGSLFTSILPNLLIPNITKALYDTDATKLYICNVATQVGETNDYSIEDHVKELQTYTFETIADYVIANANLKDIGSEFMGEIVKSDGSSISHAILKHVDLIDVNHSVRHDAQKLAKTITALVD